MQIVFHKPEYLWYLLSIPIAIGTHFLLVQRAKYKALIFANFEALKKLKQEGKVTKNIGLLIVRILLLASIIVALAQPAVRFKGKVSNNDFVIAIDASASMTSKDYYPSRLGAAKQAAAEFVKTLKAETKIAVIAFAGVPLIVQELTDDKDKVLEAIESIKPIESGGTDIPSAVITAANILANSNKGRILILATDGSNTVTPLLFDPVHEAIEYAKDHKLIVYSIGIGTEQGPIGYLPTIYNVSNVYNEEVLLEITNSTGGEHFRASDSETIKAGFEEIAEKSEKAIVEKNLTHGVLIIALLTLFLEWGLASTKYRRIP
ncbi:VWA domain-containing protein [Candidatus Woesearchaeota archaeon]|nr:VWA domain-containing protein [Candidatus Woesearchaeota archaeon]